MDPRPYVIESRLRSINRIIAVSGGKGGIGKSSIASVLALNLSAQGKAVGLLDLDLTGPSTHIILGAGKVMPEEEKGLVPPLVQGIRFMSVAFFGGDRPAPLRGADISNAIIELLAVTLWGRLDFLIIDMPPGIGDTILDVIRLVKRMEFLIVTIPSRLSLEVMKKELTMLRGLNIPIIGIVENMKTMERDRTIPEDTAITQGVPFLGSINLDPTIESALGDGTALVKTPFARQLGEIMAPILAEERQCPFEG